MKFIKVQLAQWKENRDEKGIYISGYYLPVDGQFCILNLDDVSRVFVHDGLFTIWIKGLHPQDTITTRDDVFELIRSAVIA